MEAALAALEATALAETLRGARWGYAAVNGLHVLGIALLAGAVTALDLRLLGLRREVPRAGAVRLLMPVAAAGLGLAVVTGLMLFAVRAREYAGLDVFRIKLALVALGTLAALSAHRAHGPDLATAGRRRLAGHAVLSLVCWLGALACGRLIAFVD